MDIIKLNAIGSTNTYLKELATNQSLKNGTIVVAESQLKGRGQMGNAWQSQQGKSLTFSMFHGFKSLDIANAFIITSAVSLALQKALTILQIPKVTVKWPNDIMSDSKKLCGILVENQLEGSRIDSSIIGVGLNVNETEFIGLPQATSLKLESGNTFDLDEVLTVVSKSILHQLEQLETSNPATIRSAYEAVLFKKDTIAVFETTKGNRFNAIVRGVNQGGALELETEDGAQIQSRIKELKMLF